VHWQFQGLFGSYSERTLFVQSRVLIKFSLCRALGDYEYKNVEGRGPCEQLVSPEPEVFVHDRDDERDEFLVLACDGVWDVMSNEDVCDFVRSRLLLTEDLESITSQVLDTCLYKVNNSFFSFSFNVCFMLNDNFE